MYTNDSGALTLQKGTAAAATQQNTGLKRSTPVSRVRGIAGEVIDQQLKAAKSRSITYYYVPVVILDPGKTALLSTQKTGI